MRLILFSILSLVILTTGCDKSSGNLAVNETTTSNSTDLLDAYNTYNRGNDVEEILVDKLLFLGGITLRDAAVENTDIFLDVATKVNPTHLHIGMRLSTFVAENPILESKFQYFFERNTIASPDTVKGHISLLDNEGFDIPIFQNNQLNKYAIHTFKKISPDDLNSKDFIVAIGAFINEEDEAFAFHSSEPSRRHLLSHEEAIESDIPIFIIDYSTEFDLENAWKVKNYIPPVLTANDNRDEDESSKMNNVFSVLREYRITRRFENSGRSEYRAGFAAHPADLTDSRSYNGNTYTKNIRKRDIPGTFSSATTFIAWDNVTYPFGNGDGSIDDNFFLYAWEEDWINSGKIISNDCATEVNFLDHSPTTNRKNSDDVYTSFCGVKSSVFPNPNSQVDLGNNFFFETMMVERVN